LAKTDWSLRPLILREGLLLGGVLITWWLANRAEFYCALFPIRLLYFVGSVLCTACYWRCSCILQ